MDLKTGHARQCNNTNKECCKKKPADRRIWTIELAGSLNVNADTEWKVRNSGETTAGFNQAGFGTGVDPVLTNVQGRNPCQLAEFATFNSDVKILDFKICAGKNGGQADSVMSIGIAKLDVDATMGSEVATWSTDFVAKATGIPAPSTTTTFECNDLGSVFKDIVLPKNNLIFVAMKDETGGTGNVIYFNATLTLMEV